MIVVRNLYLKYVREYYALHDINFKVEQNESVAFVGQEESGKTSMLRILAKLEEPTRGEVYIRDIPLKKLNLLTDIKMGYLPSTPIFFENKTVEQNLKWLLKEQKVPKYEIGTKINDALIEFNIQSIKDKKIKELTIYEKYLVSFARLYFRDLDIILIDDIFLSCTQEQIDVLKEIIKKHYLGKSTMIIATNDKQLAEQICQKQIYFESGSIMEDKNEK